MRYKQQRAVNLHVKTFSLNESAKTGENLSSSEVLVFCENCAEILKCWINARSLLKKLLNFSQKALKLCIWNVLKVLKKTIFETVANYLGNVLNKILNFCVKKPWQLFKKLLISTLSAYKYNFDVFNVFCTNFQYFQFISSKFFADTCSQHDPGGDKNLVFFGAPSLCKMLLIFNMDFLNFSFCFGCYFL